MVTDSARNPAAGETSSRAAPDRAGVDRPWADRTWQSADGLSLHFRDYPGRDDRPPVIALHGLTRNARDAAPLAARLAGDWRVIVPEMRGRGQSDYASDSATYNPVQYVADLKALLEQEGIARFVAIGTSLGGLMTMMLAHERPEMIAGAVLVDIGPEVDPEGLAHIREYVGHGGSFPTWTHAARALADVHGAAHPQFALDDWLAMAKRVMVLGAGGRIVFDYDMGIAEPFAAPEGAVPVDLWPAFEALAGRPVALIRGALSTILSADTAATMAARLPGLDLVTVPGIGHAPLLTEPEAAAAIDRLLASVA
ncbi:alpha/beta fold hydrolase [Altererythrobacter aerius]|uniref:Alpha/beta fold hydrolase n=1 Tax=Tsuneonella aeria TaxID=1837929 RepID=A0A6I4TET2_9SPHN|nr:alpha/beta hydrolase [Tsuneonella aeria]MXO76079.1 alpha/beta fold hydrolase [Tsuneonella aeria]